MKPTNRSPVHPGEVLLEEFLKPLGLSQMDLQKHTGWTYAKINEIVNGKRGISAKTALAFSDIFKTSPEFWLNLQANYDIYNAKKDRDRYKALITRN